MSRIGKQPVAVPANVKVSITSDVLTVESGKNKLDLKIRPEVKVVWEESEKNILVSVNEDSPDQRFARAMWGTTRSLIQNMILGVTKGYQKKLEVVGVGWSASVSGSTLELKVGYANPVLVDIPSGLDVKVERAIITVKGIDKHMVGEFSASVRAKRKPEPYNGKGVKYLDEVIRRKSGKVFGS